MLTARLENVDTEDKLAAMRNDSGISINGFPVSGGEGIGPRVVLLRPRRAGRRRRARRAGRRDPRRQGLMLERYAAIRPQVHARCATAADVVEAIALARASDLAGCRAQRRALLRGTLVDHRAC